MGAKPHYAGIDGDPMPGIDFRGSAETRSTRTRSRIRHPF